MKAMASLRWSTAPLSGTRQGAIQDLGVDLHHAVRVFDLFDLLCRATPWGTLNIPGGLGETERCAGGVGVAVPPLGHVKHTRGTVRD